MTTHHACTCPPIRDLLFSTADSTCGMHVPDQADHVGTATAIALNDNDGLRAQLMRAFAGNPDDNQ